MAVVETLTGKIRYRTEYSLFRPRKPILILQVEVHLVGSDHTDPGMWFDVDCKEWRDARVEDLEAVWNR